jgi:hypothetical protein
MRRFNRPPGIEDEPVHLRLRQVPGIRSVEFNGRPLGPISPKRTEFDLPLGPLEPRNELVIAAEPPGTEVDWGVISLVFGGAPPGAGEPPTVAARP